MRDYLAILCGIASYANLASVIMFLCIDCFAEASPPPRVASQADQAGQQVTPVGALPPSGGGGLIRSSPGGDMLVGKVPSSFEMNIRLWRAVANRDLIRSRNKTGPNIPEEVVLAEMDVDLLEAQLEEFYQTAEDSLEWLKAQAQVNTSEVKLETVKVEFIQGRESLQELLNKKKPGSASYQLYEIKFEYRVAQADLELKQSRLVQTNIHVKQLERRASELAKLRSEYFKKPRRTEAEPKVGDASPAK